MKRDRQTVNLRHAEMLALIRNRQEVLVEELSETFGISTMTVRRDLQALEEQGKISRFHGGATVDIRAVAPDEKNQVALCQRLIARRADRFARVFRHFTRVKESDFACARVCAS